MEIESYDTYAALPVAAQILGERYRVINPFVCDIWLRTFEQHLIAKDEKALYLVATADDRCVMLLPLLVCSTPKLGAIKIRSMSNFYTTVFSPLLVADVSLEQLANAVTSYLLAAHPRAVIFEFEPLRDLVLPKLIAEQYASKTKSVWRNYSKHVNCYETVLGEDFEKYLERRPSQLKNTIRRKNNLLNKEASSELCIHSSPKDVAEHYPVFRLIYQESWKEEESYPNFIGEVLQSLAGVGAAKLAIMWIDEEPAAAQIWFKIGSGWGVFKLAYRPKFRRYSVGTLLTAGIIEHLLSQRNVTEIDFFSGDDSYKADWVQSKREHGGIEIVNNRTLVGKVLSLKRRFAS